MLDVVADLRGIREALERIARALEGGTSRSLTGYEDPSALPEDSLVSYHDPEAAALDAEERAAYRKVTGKDLAPWEDVPRPIGPHGKPWVER